MRSPSSAIDPATGKPFSGTRYEAVTDLHVTYHRGKELFWVTGQLYREIVTREGRQGLVMLYRYLWDRAFENGCLMTRAATT